MFKKVLARLEKQFGVNMETAGGRLEAVSSDAKTNLPIFKLKESCVRRRYSDFEWLRSELERESKVVVPALPGKAFLRQLPFRGDDGIFDDSFIEERKQGLEQFINKEKPLYKYEARLEGGCEVTLPGCSAIFLLALERPTIPGCTYCIPGGSHWAELGLAFLKPMQTFPPSKEASVSEIHMKRVHLDPADDLNLLLKLRRIVRIEDLWALMETHQSALTHDSCS
ncbi:UNVERIFIED_CONTAM: hypothetical protein K2H54_069066 [Gekko kuhli]